MGTFPTQGYKKVSAVALFDTDRLPWILQRVLETLGFFRCTNLLAANKSATSRNTRWESPNACHLVVSQVHTTK